MTEAKQLKIVIENLSLSYGRNAPSLDQVSLTIGPGVFGLLGPNGAGKSSLMRILATLQSPTDGTVCMGTYRIGRDDQQIREIIGYLPQEFGIYKKLTAYEYLDYVALMKGIDDRRERKRQVQEMLEKVNLAAARNKKVGGFSGGMKQRVAIAQALLGDPQILIVDEPTAGLDPEERVRFRNLLGMWSANKIVLLSTHIVGDIESSCSQIAIMRQGKVLFQGTQNELLDRAAGKIWTGTVDDSALQELRSRHQVVSARYTAAGQEVRIVAEEKPFANAVAADPGLEDAYMRVTGGNANA